MNPTEIATEITTTVNEGLHQVFKESLKNEAHNMIEILMMFFVIAVIFVIVSEVCKRLVIKLRDMIRNI